MDTSSLLDIGSYGLVLIGSITYKKLSDTIETGNSNMAEVLLSPWLHLTWMLGAGAMCAFTRTFNATTMGAIGATCLAGISATAAWRSHQQQKADMRRTKRTVKPRKKAAT